ncbi:MAG: TolC family protein [Bacteroidales bacterium]|jgi:outer membrane protein TolC
MKLKIKYLKSDNIRLGLIMVLLAGFGTVWGQQGDSQQGNSWAGDAQQGDSLAGFLKEAAENNPGLKAKFSGYRAAFERVPQAGSLPDPVLEFGLFIKPMELMDGRQVADIRLMQMSPWFGTLKAAKDEASKMALAKYEEAQSVKNDLYYQVKTSWYQVYRTKQEIIAAEKNLELLRSLERMALIRFKIDGQAAGATNSGGSSGMESSQKTGNSGMTGAAMGNTSATTGTSGRDAGAMSGSQAPMQGGSQGGLVGLLRVQMEIGTLENRLAQLTDQLTTDQVRFNSILNRKPETEVFIADSLMEAPLPGSLAILSDSIVNNPMYKMYEADRLANESRINMVTKMGYPMVGIGLNYSLIQKSPGNTSMMNGKDMIMPMITATLPIYRKKYDAMRLEAGYLRDASAESAQNVRNELTVRYQEAMQQYHDAGRRVGLFRRQSELSEKTITLLTRSFSASGADFEEILRMQQQLLDYEFKKIEAVVDRNVAIATLVSIISLN